MKKLWVTLALLAALGILSLGTSALAKKGKLGGLYQAAVNNHFAPVPKTGQTDPFTTGDDGDLEKGIPWPEPRFTDNGDGTVMDNLTNLVWTKNANLFETTLPWQAACEACNSLSDGTYGLTDGSQAGDWRLPNLRELQSLIHYGFYGPALPNTEGTGQWTPGNPFTDVQTNPMQSVFYWSSTTNAYAPAVAWQVDLERGGVSDFGYVKSTPFLVWCVRGGK